MRWSRIMCDNVCFGLYAPCESKIARVRKLAGILDVEYPDSVVSLIGKFQFQLHQHQTASPLVVN